MDIKVDQGNSLPLYVQIEEQLRSLIQKTEYQEGKKLPGEMELAQKLGVARSTIRQAINALVVDGLVTRRKSAGTFVCRKPIASKARNWRSFSQEMSQLGVKVRNYELHVSWCRANAELAAFFGVGIGSKLLKLERVRGSEQRAFVHFISYFNPSIGLTPEEDFTKALYELLETKFGRIAKTSIEELSAICADEQLAQRLEIQMGNPILQRKRLVYDSENQPLEWNIGFYRADSFVYTVESHRN